jgi:hypothetical protein
MLIIKSFLKRPDKDIYDLDEMNTHPYDFFIDIDDAAEIKKISKQFNKNYLAGALIIKYYDRTIIGFRHHDLIDQLLAYFLNMLDELQTKDAALCGFPDMPLEMTIKRINKNIFYISFDASTWIEFKVPEYEFVRALLDEAHHFFTVIQPALQYPKSYYQFALGQIKNLRKIYAHDA